VLTTSQAFQEPQSRRELRDEQDDAPERAPAQRRPSLRDYREYLGAHVAMTCVAGSGIDGQDRLGHGPQE